MARSFLSSIALENGAVVGGQFSTILSSDLPALDLFVGQPIDGSAKSNMILYADGNGQLQETTMTWDAIDSFNVQGELTATKGNFTAPNKDDNALAIMSVGATQVADIVLILSPFGGTKARFNKVGIFIISVHSAPADADLNNGDLAFWFDQTPSAAKLMVKAKDSAGNVVTGSVALS